MTDASRIVDIVGPQEPSNFLSTVVDLVGYPTRCQVERESLRLDLPDSVRDKVECFIPAEPSKAPLSPAPYHGERDATELSKVFARKLGQRIHVIEILRVK
jgi:hypothetical protein